MADMNGSRFFPRPISVAQLLSRVRAAMLAAVERELALDEELAPLEVTAAQFVVISALSLGARSASDLCKEISYDTGAMTRMVDRLEVKGLLRRKRAASDRRLVNLELTEKAIAAVPSMRSASMRVVNKFLRGFSPKDVRNVEELLARMLDNGKSKS